MRRSQPARAGPRDRHRLAQPGFLRELGVDEVIDYSTTPFESVVKDVDVVLDTVGGERSKRSWAVLKRGGILVSAIQSAPETAAAHGVRQAMV